MHWGGAGIGEKKRGSNNTVNARRTQEILEYEETKQSSCHFFIELQIASLCACLSGELLLPSPLANAHVLKRSCNAANRAYKCYRVGLMSDDA